VNVREVRFKAPSTSLSPKWVFVGEVCPRDALCHIGWCVVRAKVSLWETVLALVGDELGSSSLR